MSIQEVSAERKFWGTPELIENLPFLDAFSTKNLAESHQLTRRILRNGLNWNKLIKRTFPQKRYYHYSVPEPTNVILEFEREKARLLAEILSMSKDSSQLEMDLLHAICEKFSLAYKPTGFSNTGNFVSVSCSCLQTHQVSLWGFLLLEDVAATLDSRAQSILEVESDKLMEPLLTALWSKLLRQEGMVRRLQSQQQSWTLNNLKSADSALLRHLPPSWKRPKG